jgi:cytidyltransferase-like protein
MAHAVSHGGFVMTSVGAVAVVSAKVVVAGGFDDLKSRDIRFLEEAARFGSVTALVWPDATFTALTGRPPRFSFAERRYLLEATRFVARVMEWTPDGDDGLPAWINAEIWAERDRDARETRHFWCRSHGVAYRIITRDEIGVFPPAAPASSAEVVVTGCYDWLHSGHVRFFEEAAAFGELTVLVGNDANLRGLKGAGHPLVPQEQRRYAAGAIRHVKQALIASGSGMLDAEPEIARLKPRTYVVNEDGDRGGKRAYCEARGIAYVVLKRIPAPGLPSRSSTDLRGF